MFLKRGGKIWWIPIDWETFVRGGVNLKKCNTFYRIDATRVLNSSSFRIMDEVTVRKKHLDQKFDLRTKLEHFTEKKFRFWPIFPRFTLPRAPERIFSITSFISVARIIWAPSTADRVTGWCPEGYSRNIWHNIVAPVMFWWNYRVHSFLWTEFFKGVCPISAG